MSEKQNLTIDDIARELGVSKTTISRAISGKGRIGADTRARILEYIEKCNYRPSAAAKGLAESRTYNLALVLPKSFIKLDLPHVRQNMSAICEEAFLQDYNILVCPSTEDHPDSLIRTLDNRKVDGVILTRTAENDMLVKLLIQRRIPFATLGTLPQEEHGRATVEADHDQTGGCCAFTKTVLYGAEGKIAVLGNDMKYIVNQSRMTGFQRAIEDLGISQDRIIIRTGLNTNTDRVSVTDELIRLGVTHILALDDEICMAVLKRLQQRSVRVPQQIQLACMYDNKHLESANPPISALQFDASALGQVACRELLRSLRGESFESKPLLGYRICLRESTR